MSEQFQPTGVFEPTEHPHRRLNVLTGDWVLVSPHRAKRPWQGQVEAADEQQLPAYDAHCYLCPGNHRVSGEQNPQYQGPFVFQNDFAALNQQTPAHQSNVDDLLVLQAEQGLSRVICYSPDHSKTLPELALPEIVQVIKLWTAQYQELGQSHRWVQIFENKGAINGCSNPHPHGQIWASHGVPTLPAREDDKQRQYYQQHQRNLLQSYVALELQDRSRIVDENADWLVVVPYWASWPFETLLLPKMAVQRLEQLTEAQQLSLAEILQALTSRYDNLFQCSFPYSMGWHAAPYAIPSFSAAATTAAETDNDISHWLLHAHFYPPLLRSASVKKFMVGYEMLAETQRDMTPEQAAERLRALSSRHYKTSGENLAQLSTESCR